MRVLVTGGAGYIGSHTAKALAHAGFEPVVYDNLSRGHRWAVKWGSFIEGDLADRALLGATIRRERIEAVIHFAALAYVGESVAHPHDYFQNNVVGTLALLDTMLDHGVDTCVFSSTCATYGVPASLPINETQPQEPVNPYGASKLFIERALRAYGAAYGLRSVALRYFNAAGADPDGETGEAHVPETHLIPLVIQAATGQRCCAEVFGRDYPTPDGTAVRDFIHVADLADAHVRALTYLRDGGETTALNLGTGQGHSVREVIATVEAVSGRRIPVEERPRRTGDPPALVADARRARAVLGWQPRFPELSGMIATAWRWHTGGRRAISAPDLGTVAAP